MKINNVVRVALSGGLLGMLGTSPRHAIQKRIIKENLAGWSAIYILPHSTANLLIYILQFAILICTLGLWTFTGGYLILFEKESDNPERDLRPTWEEQKFGEPWKGD